MQRILVLKFGGLGDFVQAIGPMRRIRAAHPGGHLTLLTTPPYAGLAQTSGLFDAIETDGRPARLGDLVRLARRLRCARYDRVYDLQTSSRSSLLLHLLRPRPPEWSGVAWGASHPHRNPDRSRMHTLERQAEQLRDAGVWPDAPVAPGTAPAPDLGSMAEGDGPAQAIAAFGLTAPYALLVPGASPLRPGKRWPAEDYGRLAAWLGARGLEVAILGSKAETRAAQVIQSVAPRARDLTSHTDVVQIAALGAGAALAVGNDTGPVHVVAAAGAPTLVLFSGESDPALCAPRGERVAVLRSPTLANLALDEVCATLKTLAPELD